MNRVKKWVQDNLGEEVLSMKRLPGSTSSTLYEIFTENSSVVLRQFDNKKWLAEEPDIVLHEAASLQHAFQNDLPSPALIAFDETGECSGVPSILMTKVDGKVELLPEDFTTWTDELAKVLVSIHKVKAIDFQWTYSAYTSVNDIELPSWTTQPDVWKKGYDRIKEENPSSIETFIHRDFHPANVLWENGVVSGVVDWPNACRGPASVDVGHCRLNLALLYGVDIADLFLKAYEKHADPTFQYDAYWDIRSVFDGLDGPPTVYPGWAAFGVTGLTDRMMEERLDLFMKSLISTVTIRSY